jgi:hypothetical protein
MDLKEAQALAGVDPLDHWYYASKSYPLFREFERALAENRGPIPIADVGAGEGVFTRALVRRFPGAVSHATLVDSGYASEGDSLMEGVAVSRVRALPSRFEARLILLMDVLEHIEGDSEFLQQVVSSAEPGARSSSPCPRFACCGRNTTSTSATSADTVCGICFSLPPRRLRIRAVLLLRHHLPAVLALRAFSGGIGTGAICAPPIPPSTRS